MTPFTLDADEITPEAIAGAILCQDIVGVTPAGRVRLGKGRILQSGDAIALQTVGGEIHFVRMDPGDVHEDKASVRLAQAIAGPGVELKGPTESQMYLRATSRGLVELRTDAMQAINLLPDMGIYSIFDGQPIDQGKTVAATKVTPLAVPEAVVAEAERLARDATPIVQVRPFLGGRVGVVVRDRLRGKAREQFEQAIAMKIGWFGSPIPEITYLPEDVDAITCAINSLLAENVVLLLAAGVNSTDPLDLTIQAMERAGARLERRGVPAHPGSTCWLAYIGDVPVFGLALCGMFSQTTVLDLLLPRFLSGRHVSSADLAALGHGGLLSQEMGFRFPPYIRRSVS